MSRWETFFKQIQQDFKLYVFILAVFCLFRVSFILYLNKYLDSATAIYDIWLALIYGFRISLKSAGVVVLLSFLFSTVLVVISKNDKLEKIRSTLGYFYIFILTLLLHIRIPYYEVFHVAFNQFLFNTFKDDAVALFVTIMHEYNLPLRFFSIICISLILCKLLKRLLQTQTFALPQLSNRSLNIAFRIALVAGIVFFMIFTRFGGSLTYTNSVHWENAVVTKDNFLNEAILDDIQALYRAYSAHETLKKAAKLNIDPKQVKKYGTLLAGKDIDTTNVEDYFRKEAQGAIIPKPPHIFLIIGESYAEWPLLPEFKDLNIANGMKSILDKDNAVLVKPFLPTGTGTMAGINGIITGFPEVNLYPNYQQESYKTVYATSLAAQMKKLGYKTRFWYAGFASWQRIKEFTLAQGFDDFYSCSDFTYASGNSWGSEDKYFIEGFNNLFKGEQPSFNVILTSSNHPPYTVNIQSEGFSDSIVTPGLSGSAKTDNDLITKLGHFWYADKYLSKFIEDMRQKYPQSLFVVTGDHADRVNITPTPSMFERYAIPFILYGPGIHKNLFAAHVAGSHIDIEPTLIELIAPKDFVYHSVGESLTKGSRFGSNYAFWISDTAIGEIDSENTETLAVNNKNSLSKPDFAEQRQAIDAMRGLAWWRISTGAFIQ
ncbi:LTA synthase family protein [Sporomusa sp.]|uniref:LTA synthase family protein n=1 Tax=Sporomusa sp. TaxID=2078658 RepID=UPI002C9D1485|nr:LTA synthase family protein [Sporomusa sp.]HWR44298.1 LTA synthase family protein [Sporomusa sp.]